MVMSVAMGYAVIINLVATSYYEFYPVKIVIGAAFAVGIAMVVGCIIFFLGEPKPIDFKRYIPTGTVVSEGLSMHSLHTVRRTAATT